MKKRLLAFLMCFVLCMGLLFNAAFAAPDDGPLPNAIFVRNVDFGTIKKYVGETGDTGVTQRLPRLTDVCGRCRHTLREFIPDDYYGCTYTLSNPEVLKDCTFKLSNWNGTDSYAGMPCFEFSYTAASVGTTTVTLVYYYQYDAPAEYGYCGYCGSLVSCPRNYNHYYETASFTVIVGEKYDIIYQTEDADNVTGMPSGEKDIVPGLEKEVSGAVPVREGYVFGGWSTSDVTVEDGKFIMPEKDVTFTAIWKEDKNNNGEADEDEDKYDIIYQTEDAANVTGMPTGEQNVLPGLEKEVSGAVPARPGYVFGGWSTSDVTVEDGKFIMPEKDVTFTAIWKEDKNNNGEADEDEDKYDIIYQTEDAANVTGMPTGEQNVLPGLEKEVSGAVPVREGYVFGGWSTSDVTVEDGKFIMPEKDVTFTAIWKEDKNNNGEADEDEDKYDIIYQTEDAANVTGMPTGEQDVLPGLEKELSDVVPEREGYNFKGWATEDAALQDGKFIMPEKDVVFKAVWEKKEPAPDTGDQGIIAAAAGLALLGAVFAVVVVTRRRKKSSVK